MCRIAAHTGVWGSGEATIRSTRNLYINDLMIVHRLKYNIGVAGEFSYQFY
jgi:hypothetical protein